MMPPNTNNLIWIDLEMTGLKPESDHIIEIATVVTDAELKVLATGPNLVIHQPDAVLDGMDDWNQQHHGASGLIQRVQESRISAADAENQTLEFLRLWVPAGASPMCGNTVCQDRRFLYREMAALEAWFHYRHIDVSTFKELVRRWSPTAEAPEKSAAHRALDDIMESIAELRHYRQFLSFPGC